MTAFTIMAHALAQELRSRGVEIPLAECEEILRRVVDRAEAVASRRPPQPPAPADQDYRR